MNTFAMVQNKRDLGIELGQTPRPAVVAVFGYLGLLGIAAWAGGLIDLWDGNLFKGLTEVGYGLMYTIFSKALLRMKNWARVALLWLNLCTLLLLLFVDAYIFVWVPWELGAWGSPPVLLKYILKTLSDRTLSQVLAYVLWHGYVYGFLGTFTQVEIKKAFWRQSVQKPEGLQWPCRAYLVARTAMVIASLFSVHRAIQRMPQPEVASITCSGDPHKAPLDCALVVIQRTPISDIQRLSLLERIAMAYARIGKVDQAMQISQAITWPLPKAKVLTAVAQTLVTSRYPQYTPAVLDEASEAISLIEDMDIRTEYLADLASLCADAGHREQAVQIAENLPTPAAQVKAYARIAVAYGRANQTEQAVEILDRVADKAGQIRDQDAQDLSLALLASAAVKTGRTDWAIQKAEKIRDNPVKARVLGEAAIHLFRGTAPEATNVLSRATDLIDRLDPTSSTAILQTLSEALAQANQFSLATKTANKLHAALPKAWALNRIAAEHIRANRGFQALQVLDHVAQCLEESQTDRTGQQSVSLLLAVVDNYEQLGQMQAADAVLADLVRLSDQIENTHHKAAAFSAIALRYSQRGQFQKAYQMIRRINIQSVKTDTMISLLIECEDTGAAGDLDSVPTILDQVLTDTPSHLAVWLGMGR